MKPSRDLVIQKVMDYWPDDDASVLARLDVLNILDSEEAGVARIQLAVLKLAQSDMGKLGEYIEAALGDPRDVLAWAEYPRQMRAPHLDRLNLSRDEAQKSKSINKADRDEYLAWLEEDGDRDVDDDDDDDD